MNNKYYEKYQFLFNKIEYSILSSYNYERLDNSVFEKIKFIVPGITEIDNIKLRKYSYYEKVILCYEIQYQYFTKTSQTTKDILIPVDYAETQLRIKKLERIIE